MVESAIPIPSQCSVSDCSVWHLPRTRSYLLHSLQFIRTISGFNFSVPLLSCADPAVQAPNIAGRATRSYVSHLFPSKHVSRTSTATVGPSRSTSIIHDRFINRIYSNYASSLLQKHSFCYMFQLIIFISHNYCIIQFTTFDSILPI